MLDFLAEFEGETAQDRRPEKRPSVLYACCVSRACSEPEVFVAQDTSQSFSPDAFWRSLLYSIPQQQPVVPFRSTQTGSSAD